MLRDALGELRDHLDAAGVHAGELTVSDGGVGARDHDGTHAQAAAATGADDPTSGSDATNASSSTAADLETEATSLFDVRV